MLVLAGLATPTALAAQAAAGLTYPQSRKADVIDLQFGEAVTDPYRWLENDVRTDREVANWVAAQNAATDAYLAKLPQREWFARRIRELLDYERFGLPQKAGGRYFYTRNSGLQNQSQLFMRKGLGGKPRLLIDPNLWSNDGTAALDEWVPSRNGKLLAYAVQDGGSDWRTIRIIDTKSGKDLADELRWVKFSSLAWIGSEGFLYSRYPAPGDGTEYQAVNVGHAVFFHRVGTPQSADEPVYATPDRPGLIHRARVTWDDRWAVISTSQGTESRFELHAIPLAGQRKAGPVLVNEVRAALLAGKPLPTIAPRRDWTAIELVNGLDHNWRLIDGVGDSLWFITNSGAGRGKMVRADLDRWIPPGRKNGHTPALGCGPVDGDPCGSEDDPPWTFHEVVPEREDTLNRAQIVGNRLLLSYLKDASTRAEMISLDGRPVQAIRLGVIGTASGFSGRPGDPETFYTFASFNQPPAVFRFDSNTGQSTPFAVPKVSFNPADYDVEQRNYTSRDGTRVPMFLVRKRAIAQAGKAVPTLLYGYGGFEVSQVPSFSATRMAWLEAGGAFALANLRGGGEFGKAWHDGGRLANKQNVFDDFIAAGEYLIARGVTPRNGLVIQGGSNGGLLVGAVLNQRPDLFAAAVPQVGVMDMLRFDRFTAGRNWVPDYGQPSIEADWRVLRAYSPYHNLKAGVAYPPVLITTADTDDRVVPAHSFKYAAALQAANPAGKPHLIRIQTRAGHGSGKPTDKVIDEGADVLGFLSAWSGLEVDPRP
jgi:prolyl oligopeptidase